MTAPHLEDSYDVAVIGAGPSGMSAATIAALRGLKTVVLDEQHSPGGQIYRAIAASPMADRSILGPDYWHGEDLLAPFADSGAVYVPGATVWSVSPDREIGVTVGGVAHMIQARQIILATGAQERPFPIPGWTLPGVMTAGAGQILLKTSGLVPDGRVVLAGTGPLLYLIAWQYLRAGGKIAALLDTTPTSRYMDAIGDLPAFLGSAYFAKGLKLMLEVRRKVKIVSGVTSLEARGTDKVEAVAYRRKDGPVETIAADLVLLHQGVVPNVNLSFSIGIKHIWDELQICWKPEHDEWGATSIAGISIAGDGGGISGALAAEQGGRLAGLDAAMRLGAIDQSARDRDAAPLRSAYQRALAGRRFLDRVYQPPKQFRVPTGDTLACRCEEVTAAQVTETVKFGCTGPNQMKSFLRCGMGPCQGRFCGLTVAELIADARGVSPEEVGYYRLRPPIKPITLGELAALPQTDDSVKAVVRG